MSTVKPQRPNSRKGKPNKFARKRISVADKLEEKGVDLISEIWAEAIKLEGKERVDCLLKLLEYCAPKMRSVEIEEKPSDDDLDNTLDKIPRDRIVALFKETK